MPNNEPLGFKCPGCGKWHDSLPDIAYDRPYYVHEVPEAERASRVRLGTDLCIIDDELFFIRCMLLVPIRGTDRRFGWGVWSSLSETNFQRYNEHYDDDISDWPPMFGWLSNLMSGYPDTLSLELSVQGQVKGQRPTLTVQTMDHPLAEDQRNGITLDRAIELALPDLHGTAYKA
jgi:hypothetical protein